MRELLRLFVKKVEPGALRSDPKVALAILRQADSNIAGDAFRIAIVVLEPLKTISKPVVSVKPSTFCGYP